MKIKVCGLKEADQMMALADLSMLGIAHDHNGIAQSRDANGYQYNVDFVGINFYKDSPRYYQGESLANLHLGRTKKVGIFVNATEDQVIHTIQYHKLDYVQLHGEETPAYCALIADHAMVIKALPHYVINEQDALHKFRMCELFLFDTASVNYGGSGEKFDWTMLKEYNGPRPYLLAGGIGLEDVSKINGLKNQYGFLGIDINSKFESTPGIKDLNKISLFIKTLRNEL